MYRLINSGLKVKAHQIQIWISSHISAWSSSPLEWHREGKPDSLRVFPISTFYKHVHPQPANCKEASLVTCTLAVDVRIWPNTGGIRLVCEWDLETKLNRRISLPSPAPLFPFQQNILWIRAKWFLIWDFAGLWVTTYSNFRNSFTITGKVKACIPRQWFL